MADKLICCMCGAPMEPDPVFYPNGQPRAGHNFSWWDVCPECMAHDRCSEKLAASMLAIAREQEAMYGPATHAELDAEHNADARAEHQAELAEQRADLDAERAERIYLGYGERE